MVAFTLFKVIRIIRISKQLPESNADALRTVLKIISQL